MKPVKVAAAACLAMAMAVMAPESRAELQEPGEKNRAESPEAKRITLLQEVAVVVGRLPDREAVLGNIGNALRNARVNAAYLDRERVRKMPAEGLLAYRALIIAEDDMDGYSAPVLAEYARRGGGVIFVRYAKLGPEFLEMTGLAQYGGGIIRSRDFDVAGGFLFNNRRLALKGVDITAKEARVNGVTVFSRLRPAGESRDLPLGWTRAIGEGGVLYWNTEAVARRESFQGFIVQSLHYLCRGFVTGLANVGMMTVDDLPGTWPAAGKGATRGIKALSPRDTWVKGIDGLGRRFGFNFTAYLIMRGQMDAAAGKAPRSIGFHHEGVVVPPSRKGTATAKKGWELALHGLSAGIGERPGPPHGEAGRGANAPGAILREWEAKFGRKMQPASCAITAGNTDDAVLSKLGEAFPSIKAVRVPSGTGARFGRAGDSRYYAIPVLSSGFAPAAETELALWSGLHALGVVSHSISPEEYVSNRVFQDPRGWDRFAGSFIDSFERVRSDFPWLRWMTAGEAFERLRAYEAAELHAQRDGKIITVHVDNCSEPLYFRTRLKPGEQIRKVDGCGLVNIHRDSGDIVFKSYGRVSRVILR